MMMMCYVSLRDLLLLLLLLLKSVDFDNDVTRRGVSTL